MYLITSFSREVIRFGLRVWGMVRGGWGVNLSNETTMTLSGVINMPSTFIWRKENNHFTRVWCGGGVYFKKKIIYYTTVMLVPNSNR